MKYNYVIVGGGIIGLSIAYYILKKAPNKKVVILEKKYIGSGGSTRNASHFRVHFWSEENVIFAVNSWRLIRGFSVETGWNPIYMFDGYLWLIPNKKILKAYEDTNRRIWSKYDVPVNIIDINDVKKEYPYINTEGFIAGVFGPQDGKLHHDFVIYGYLYSHLKRGGKVMEYTPVKRILVKNNDVIGVETSRGVIEGDEVIIAAGDGSKYIMNSIGIELPIRNERRELWVSEPVKLFIKPLIVDLREDSAGLYIAQSPRGEVMGSIDYPDVYEDLEYNVSFRHFREFSRLAIRLIPSLKYLRVMRTWSGNYVVTPDYSHILGRDGKWPEHLHVATGFSGHGFMLGPYTGEIMSEYLLKDYIPKDMKPFLSSRFRENKLIRESMVIG